MSWSILFVLVLVLGLSILGVQHRRAQARRLHATLRELGQARELGSDKAQLQFPVVDLSRCLGCGTCVRACPEEGVLGLVHGQASVIHGARCVGHGLCATACPLDAIEVTLGDLQARSDIPVISDQLEADGVPGLFLAGEVTGYALVRTAISHGAAVARRVEERLPATRIPARPLQQRRTVGPQHRRGHPGRRPVNGTPEHGAGGVALLDRPSAPPVAAAPPDRILDLCIVGAGPAGLACALAAKERGLDAVTLERDSVGGTVAKYPRRKLVMTQPVELPLYGRLRKTSYIKEELMGIWEGIAAEHQLPIRTGEEFTGLQRHADGTFTVETRTAAYRARNVCLALGRRGTPRQLDVPGEELPKVVYSLIDAESYRDRRILVVGGGDSAIEAAVGLAEQPGNIVHLSYRKAGFFRIKAKNRANLERKVAEGSLQVLYESEVAEIAPDRVRLTVRGADPGPGGGRNLELPNDEVFVFAGGIPPFELLERCAVSFDASRRPPTVAPGERGTGILHALTWGLLLSLLTLAWCFALSDYYSLPWTERPDSPWHSMLEPTGPIGLTAGVLASLLIVLNLAYVVRRARLGRFIAGSLTNWLSLHVVTGILALLFLIVHGGMVVRHTPGGMAFLAVVILVITGGIGRYFYAYLPKAANGRKLAHDEARAALDAAVTALDQAGRGLGAAVRAELDVLLEHRPWGTSLAGRIRGLLGARRFRRVQLARLERAARAQGIAPQQIDELVGRARELHHTAVVSHHFEDLAGMIGSWRFIHRWLALAMVILAVNHIVTALRYGEVW